MAILLRGRDVRRYCTTVQQGVPARLHPDSFWSTFEALARSAGGVEAILAPGRRPLRFADLPARLIAVREALAAQGIGRGDRVASALPRGSETAVCFLGVASCAIVASVSSRL